MLEIGFKRYEAVAVLELSGTIDIDSAIFIERVGWCLENGYTDILCNFEDVNLVDYAGLSVLTISLKDVLNHGGRMKLANVASHIKKILSLVALDKVFEIYEDFDRAVKSFEEDKVISEIQKKQLRRRFKRLPLDIDIQLKSLSRNESFFKAKVLNLSAVGLLVFSDKVYPLGEILKIRLDLEPSPGVIEIEAKVVWLVEKEIQPQIYPGMGLEFYNLNSEVQKKILEFVERNLPLGTINE